MGVAVVGAGNWGRNLVRTFHRLGELAGVAEVDLELRKTIHSQYPGVFVWREFSELLESDVPALAIATPAQTHYQLAREALLAGKDVFVEKPMALSRAEAEELLKLATSKNRILMAGHLLLYQPAIRWLKNHIASGAIGEMACLYQERLKLGRVRSAENVLWSFGVHDIAVLLYLVGEKPQEVNAVGRCFLQEGIEDDVHVHLKFSGGVQAHLHVSWLWPEQRRRLAIVGSKAMLTYDELSQEVVLHKKRITPELRNRDEGSKVVFRGNEEPLLLECRHFLECVAGRKEPLSCGRSALEVIEVLERAGKQFREDKV